MAEDLERVKGLLRFAPEEEVDQHSKKNLKSRLYKWKNRNEDYLADLEYFINGKEYPSLIDGIIDQEELEKMKIKFLRPNLDGEWLYSTPTMEIMEKFGRGLAKTFEYDHRSFDKWAGAGNANKEEVMVRGYISDHFFPVSIKTKSQYHHAEEVPNFYEPRLKKLRDLWDDLRSGVVPFKIRLCLYTKKDRYAYVIDPIADKQRPHPLNETSVINDVDHEPMEYMHLDHLLAGLDIDRILKYILEFVFENGELSLPDIAHTFDLKEKIAQNNMDSLESRGLVSKRKDIYYSIDMESISEIAKERF